MVRYAEGNNFGSSAVKIEKEFKSVTDSMNDAGLNYNVSLQDCFLADGTQVPKTKVTVRDDKNEVLGVVGERYQVVQNQEAFGFFDEFIENKFATIEHAGLLGKSNIVFVQAKILCEPIEIIKGDVIQSYATLLNSHDGTTSVVAMFMPIRLFCANQLPKLKTSNKLKLKHTKNVHLGLDKIKQIMDLHNREFAATAEQYRYLASKGVNKKDLERYVRLVFGKDEEENETEVKEMRKSKVEAIAELYENGRGASNATHNYFGAFQAVNEYLNYEAGRSVDNRLKSLWVGANADVNRKAFEIALELTKG